MRTPKVPGHKLVITQRTPGIGRSSTMICAKCECGFNVQLWADRMSVARTKHRAHLIKVRQS